MFLEADEHSSSPLLVGSVGFSIKRFYHHMSRQQFTILHESSWHICWFIFRNFVFVCVRNSILVSFTFYKTLSNWIPVVTEILCKLDFHINPTLSIPTRERKLFSEDILSVKRTELKLVMSGDSSELCSILDYLYLGQNFISISEGRFKRI